MAAALGMALHRRLAAPAARCRPAAPAAARRAWLAVPAASALPGRVQASPEVFDRRAKRLQRARAAEAPDSQAYDYLRVEAADLRMLVAVERLLRKVVSDLSSV